MQSSVGLHTTKDFRDYQTIAPEVLDAVKDILKKNVIAWVSKSTLN